LFSLDKKNFLNRIKEIFIKKVAQNILNNFIRVKPIFL